LAGLAAFAAGEADGWIRTTPWRSVVVVGAGDAAARAGEWGLVSDPADKRLGITICPGQPACASGLIQTRPIADLLAKLGLEDVHVSGCAKGCAHPGPAAITVVGGVNGVGVVRNGRAGDLAA